MPKMSTFLPAMWPAFFMRVSPASRNAKPACMNMTSTAVMKTQIVDAAMSRSWFLGTDPHLPEQQPRAVVRHVLDRSRPDEAVARFVAGARRVDDRRDHLLRAVVVDDERQQRLRQEPRLEHGAPVLVGDAASPPVTDRFDDRYAHVAGRLLHRVDHGLHPLPGHDRLHIDHPRPPPGFEHKKSAPRAEALEAPMPRAARASMRGDA